MPIGEGPNCTVCIPTYNQSGFVGAAVMSAVGQSVPVNVLVSNDCSTDNTAEVLAELQHTHAFTVHNHPANLGISTHLRWLLQQPQTPFIMRLDSDDLLHSDYVKELSTLLERHPTAGYAHCAVLEIDSKGNERKIRQLGRTNEFETPDDALKKSVQGYRVAANILMFRREALAAVDFGGGSEKLNFVEDYDLSVRIADAGWGNVYCGKVLASYRVWEGASRPVVGRKLQELRGLDNIFSGSLKTAFAKRNWSDQPLRKKRVQLALTHSGILEGGTFQPGERAQMSQALVTLAGNPAYASLLGDHTLARWTRQSFRHYENAKTALKQRVKRVLFRMR